MTPARTTGTPPPRAPWATAAVAAGIALAVVLVLAGLAVAGLFVAVVSGLNSFGSNK